MTEEQIREALGLAPKGANIKASWTRPCKMRAAFRNVNLTKTTKAVIRLGVNYDHKEPVKQGRIDGTLPPVNAGLKGFEWAWHPYFLRSLKSGALMLRVERGTGSNCKAKTEYRLNGDIVSLDTVKHMVLGNELRKSTSATFNVPIANITQLHKVKVSDTNNEDEGEAVTA